MAEFFFVGGYADGEWREVSDNTAALVLTEYQKGPIWHGSGLAEARAIKKHPYEKLRLTLPSGTISFFVADGITAAEAIHRLLRSYTPTTDR